MKWSGAVAILQDVSRGCSNDRELEPWVREFCAAAVRYAHFRAEWALANREAQVAMDRPSR
jgi:hypothetical protein